MLTISENPGAEALAEPKRNAVIRLDHVSVRYHIPTEPIRTLKERVIRRLNGRPMDYRDFYALKDVTFEIQAGEFVGLIGRNGAGKSTLLKVISRVLRPTAGSVRVEGAVAAIIELGAGSHPELTGRENIYISGSLLGFSNAQIRRRIDEIIEFAELEDFIDSPLRTYSTGMMARLGFAVAADVNPDILIIDEALAVGDERFQQKCLAKMNDFRRQGVTILFVTHAVDLIRTHCTQAVLMANGQIQYAGNVDNAIQIYRQDPPQG